MDGPHFGRIAEGEEAQYDVYCCEKCGFVTDPVRKGTPEWRTLEKLDGHICLKQPCEGFLTQINVAALVNGASGDDATEEPMAEGQAFVVVCRDGALHMGLVKSDVLAEDDTLIRVSGDVLPELILGELYAMLLEQHLEVDDADDSNGKTENGSESEISSGSTGESNADNGQGTE